MGEGHCSLRGRWGVDLLRHNFLCDSIWTIVVEYFDILFFSVLFACTSLTVALLIEEADARSLVDDT